MEGLDFWRICDEISLMQAALLIAGENPAQWQEKVNELPVDERPQGYEAARTALTNAIKGSRLEASIVYEEEWFEHPLFENQGGSITTERLDENKTILNVECLREWLKRRGFTNGFFFPDAPCEPDYLNPAHPNYAQKLAAAVRAWQAVTTDSKYLDNAKTPKQNIENWLTANAQRLGLMNEDGEINNDAIRNQISKVANWQERGGAPKTPSR